MAEKLEHEALEKDIERLAQEVQERKEAGLEKPPETAVREALKERIYPTPPSVATPPTPPVDTASQVLPAYLQKESPEGKLKVEELILLSTRELIRRWKKPGNTGRLSWMPCTML